MTDIESDPYERICTRLNGLQAISVLAVCAEGGVSDHVWSNLWYFTDTVISELHRDADLLHQQRSQTTEAGK